MLTTHPIFQIIQRLQHKKPNLWFCEVVPCDIPFETICNELYKKDIIYSISDLELLLEDSEYLYERLTNPLFKKVFINTNCERAYAFFTSQTEL
jgi:hypothetical protein